MADATIGLDTAESETEGQRIGEEPVATVKVPTEDGWTTFELPAGERFIVELPGDGYAAVVETMPDEKSESESEADA